MHEFRSAIWPYMVRLAVTLRDLKSNQFIFVSKCTLVVNLVWTFSQTVSIWSRTKALTDSPKLNACSG